MRYTTTELNEARDADKKGIATPYQKRILSDFAGAGIAHSSERVAWEMDDNKKRK